MLVLKGTYISDLFLEREWVPYVLTLFFGWSVGILVLKYLNLRTQRTALLVEVLPVQISRKIDESNLDQFLDHIHRIPPKISRTYM